MLTAVPAVQKGWGHSGISPSTWEAKAVGAQRVQSQLSLHSEFEASQGYVWHALVSKQKQTKILYEINLL